MRSEREAENSPVSFSRGPCSATSTLWPPGAAVPDIRKLDAPRSGPASRSKPTNQTPPRSRIRVIRPLTESSVSIAIGPDHEKRCSPWITERVTSPRSGSPRRCGATTNNATAAQPGGARSVHRAGSSPVAATNSSTFSRQTRSEKGPYSRPSNRSMASESRDAWCAVDTSGSTWRALAVPGYWLCSWW